MNAKLAKRFWQLHSACAVYTGGFLALILITGAVAVFAPPLYEWEFREVSRIEPATLDWEMVTPAIAKVDKLMASYGGTPQLFEFELPATPTHALRIGYYNAASFDEPLRLSSQWYLRSVFLHPETGAILGVAEDDRSLATYLRDLHVRLFAGTPGRNFVGLFGLALLVLSVSGLLILSRFLGKKALWLIRRNSPRATNADTHKLVGFLLLLPALLFAITGFWLGMQGRLMNWFDIARPEIFERSPVIEPARDAALPLDFAGAIEVAQKVYPELIPETIGWSTDGQRTLRIDGRIEPMIYERRSQGVVLDKADLSLLQLNNTPKGPWTEKLFNLQEGLHFGEWGGMPGRWLYFGVGLLLGALPVTGYAVHLFRSRQSLRKLGAWSAVGLGYTVVFLAIVKTQGSMAANVFGTLSLWAFVAGLAVFWTGRSLGARFSSRRKAPAQTPIAAGD